MTSSQFIISLADLIRRRRMLRHHRRLKMLLFLWQALAVSSLFGSLVWAMTRPNWILRDVNQIVVEGNHLLPRQTIVSLLPFDYPQWLLQISPEAIAHILESQPAIADVTVTRRLFPPSLIVQVQERVPVALGVTKVSPDSPTSHRQASVGFLAQDGVWIPLQSYPAEVRRFLKSPNLKVIGRPEYYRSYWSPLYQAVSRSPVKVMEINCQDPANLILKTEMGIVHLGPYTPQLIEQLKVLDQMRQLPKQFSSSQVAYIDLKNPAAPLVQMHQTQNLVKQNTP